MNVTEALRELARQYGDDVAALAPDADAVERGNLLYLAGWTWHQAGEFELAEQQLLTGMALGPEAGASARVALASLRFDQGRSDEAHELMRGLKHIDAQSYWPYHRAAVLCENRGDYRDCVEFADLAFTRIPAEGLAIWQNGGDSNDITPVITRRRRARQALGLRSDDLDDSAEDILNFRLHLQNIAGSLSTSSPTDVQFGFWPRGEVDAAHAAWPDHVTVTEMRMAAQYRFAEESLYRIHRGTVTLVPFTVAGLTEFARESGQDPLDESTRTAMRVALIDAGQAISWPPARNEPCWCGSTVKYKNCCGRPIPD
jgi:tetratricopeptide (TPR) repeat protein